VPDDHTACDRCQASAAALLAHYPGIRPRPPRWCPTCAGPALVDLARHGHVVTITGVNVGASPAPENDEVGVSGLNWTVEKAVQMLLLAQPAGSKFLRALIDEGGHATAARLRELTGVDRLNPMTGTLNAAARNVFGIRRFVYNDRTSRAPAGHRRTRARPRCTTTPCLSSSCRYWTRPFANWGDNPPTRQGTLTVCRWSSSHRFGRRRSSRAA
jgi:hypothetical protein